MINDKKKIIEGLPPHLMSLLVLAHWTEFMLLCFNPMKYPEIKTKISVNLITIYKHLYVTENKQTQRLGGQLMAPDSLH